MRLTGRAIRLVDRPEVEQLGLGCSALAAARHPIGKGPAVYLAKQLAAAGNGGVAAGGVVGGVGRHVAIHGEQPGVPKVVVLDLGVIVPPGPGPPVAGQHRGTSREVVGAKPLIGRHCADLCSLIFHSGTDQAVVKTEEHIAHGNAKGIVSDRWLLDRRADGEDLAGVGVVAAGGSAAIYEVSRVAAVDAIALVGLVGD